MEKQDQPHQRRPRYKGTHPKSFQEKYKELQPELYADTVAGLIQKGKTPAGMHRPICVNEILEILQVTPGQVGLDATLGVRWSHRGDSQMPTRQRTFVRHRCRSLGITPYESSFGKLGIWVGPAID